MAHYKITEKKIRNKANKVIRTERRIIVDMGEITHNEMKIVQAYLSAGYKLKETRPKTETKGTGITAQKMVDYLTKHDQAGLEAYNKMKEAKTNYFKILRWFQTTYTSYPKAPKK